MRRLALLLVALALLAAAAPAGAAPEGHIAWAVHTTLVPTYFDPAETIIAGYVFSAPYGDVKLRGK